MTDNFVKNLKHLVNNTQLSIQASPISSSAVSPDDFESKVIFDAIEIELKENGADYVKRLKGIYCFKIKSGNKTGVWVIDMKNGNGSVTFNPNGKGEVTLTLFDEDLPKLLLGELSPQQAFFQGKVKLAGNLGLALRLREFQPQPNSKL